MRSKEELIDMIQSTITSNGARNITGSILQEVLLEIVDSMGSAGSGGGGGASAALVFIDINGTTETCTAAQIQNNATVFASIKTATLNGTCIPAVYLGTMMEKENSYVSQYIAPMMVMYTPETSEYPEMVAMIATGSSSEGQYIMLLPDGTVANLIA